MKRSPDRLLLATALAASLATTPCAADIILLGPEVTTLRYLSEHPASLSPTDRALLDSLSAHGRSLLAQGRAVAAVTVSDQGVWLYRNEGQMITNPLAATALNPGDVATIVKLLDCAQARIYLPVLSRAATGGSILATASALGDKLHAIDAGVAAGTIDGSTSKKLIGLVGEEIESGPDGVRVALEADTKLRPLSVAARVTADARRLGQELAIQKFVANGSTAYRLNPGVLPSHPGLTGSVVALATDPGDPNQVWKLQSSVGTYVFECKADAPDKCVDSANNTLLTGKVARAMFIPKDEAPILNMADLNAPALIINQ